MKASNYVGVLARIYLGISFFFSDHGNAQPNEAARFLKFALKNGYSWYQVCSTQRLSRTPRLLPSWW
jgi:hypothetical protein